MNDYANIAQVIVPPAVITTTMETLRAAGQHGDEAFVFWVGMHEGPTFTVTAAYVPAQTAYQTTTGVCVIVRAEELHRLNVWLYEHHLELIAQIHSHPTEAYHSETDDAYPIATRIGSFSFVIPNFATADFDMNDIAAYRLTVNSTWDELTPPEKRTIFCIDGVPRATTPLPA